MSDEKQSPEKEAVKVEPILLTLKSQGQEKNNTFIHDVKDGKQLPTGRYHKLNYAVYKVTDGRGILENGVEMTVSGIKDNQAVPPSILLAWK